MRTTCWQSGGRNMPWSMDGRRGRHHGGVVAGGCRVVTAGVLHVDAQQRRPLHHFDAERRAHDLAERGGDAGRPRRERRDTAPAVDAGDVRLRRGPGGQPGHVHCRSVGEVRGRVRRCPPGRPRAATAGRTRRCDRCRSAGRPGRARRRQSRRRRRSRDSSRCSVHSCRTGTRPSGTARVRQLFAQAIGAARGRVGEVGARDARPAGTVFAARTAADAEADVLGVGAAAVVVAAVDLFADAGLRVEPTVAVAVDQRARIVAELDDVAAAGDQVGAVGREHGAHRGAARGVGRGGARETPRRLRRRLRRCHRRRR